MRSVVRLSGALLLLMGLALPGFPQRASLNSQVLAKAQGDAAKSPLDHPARLQVENVPLADALAELRRSSGIPLAFSPSLLPADRRVSCVCGSVSVGEALENILAGTGLRFDESGRHIVIRPGDPRVALTATLQERLRGLVPAGRLATPGPRPSPGTRVLRTLDRRSRQEVGTVTGRAVNATTNAPLSSAQISIVGTSLGTLTSADGRFVIPGVPAGTQQVRAQLIGMSTETRSVVVRTGETSVVDFRLREQAVALDEVVVTGLPTEGRRREIGASLSQIDAEELETRSIPNMESLLQASVPGVMGLTNHGQVGSSGALQLRGPTSVSQGNEPLVYIDGVRLSTRRTPASAAFDGRDTRVSGFSWNDLNMADIDRVEIIKGAAATALYGTEASGGVIQIFTKRGTTGAPQYSFSTTQGANFWPTPSAVIREHPTNLDIDYAEHVGWVQRYNASVRGGREDLNYYLSGGLADEEGIIRTQWSKKWTATGNVAVNLFEGADLTFTSTFTHRRTRQVPDGNNRYGYLLNVMRVGNGYWAGNRDHDWVLEQENFGETETFLGGLDLSYVHAGGFRHNLRLGLHHLEVQNTGLQPYGWFLNPGGTIRNQRWQNRLQTLEYAGTWERDVTSGIRSSLSWGGQLYDERNVNVIADGLDFPGPGEHTVSSAAVTTGSESKIRQVNAGFFLQEMVGIQDRLFVTGAARIDGSSTFGEDYGFQLYPKLSVSYVLSDMDAWPTDWWSSFRLRGALGTAGKAPGAFDAQRTWDPISAKGGQPGVSPGNVGNPNLGPERTTEFEAGFDSDMFDARLSVQFTYYHATTDDALFDVQPIPSQGFLSSQLANVGKLRSSGIELATNVLLIDAPSLSWGVGANLTTIDSEIIDMGRSAPFGVGRLQEIREGYAPPSFFGRKLANPSDLADPVFEEGGEPVFLGQTFPSLIASFSSDATFGPFTLSGVGELMRGGHIVNAVGWLNTIREVWPACTAIQQEAATQGVDGLTAAERAKCLRDFTGADQFVESADFFKLRNLTLAFRVPDNLLPLAVGSATLSVTGSNLFKLTDYTGVDPESHQGGSDHFYREDYYSIPPMRSLVTRLSVTF